MRLLKESLLSLLVVAVVVSLYFLAASAALFNLGGFVSSGGESEAADHLKIAAT
jgi:hypothetical protein